MRLRDRVVVVTGIGGGIGRAVAASFAAEGALVAGIDRIEPEDGFLGDLASSGHGGVFASCDVRSNTAVDAAFASIREKTGRIDILVTCAGVREISSALDLTVAEWETVLAVNLSGTFFACVAASRHMINDARPGAIVTVSSIAGLVGVAHRPAYTASKHGIIGLTKVLARELAPHSIRANVLAPGLIRTPLTETYCADEKFVSTDLPVTIPLATYGLPSDVAQAAVFLASDEARYVTGTVLPVDGGFMAERNFSISGPASSYFNHDAQTQ